MVYRCWKVMGCAPFSLKSIMDKRRWPKWTVASLLDQKPSPSGPRCANESHMLRTFVAELCAEDRSIIPAIPHIMNEMNK